MSRQRRAPGRPPGQRGIALLGAMLVTALVVAIAASIAQRSRFDIAATARVLEAGAADRVFTALEDEARGTLLADGREGIVDHFGEAWAEVALTSHTDTASGRGRLHDMQGLFNLNNLVPSAAGAVPSRAAPPAAAQPTGAAPSGSDPAQEAAAGPGTVEALPASSPPAYPALPVAAAGDPASKPGAAPEIGAPSGGAGGGPSVTPRFTFDSQAATREFLAALPAIPGSGAPGDDTASGGIFDAGTNGPAAGGVNTAATSNAPAATPGRRPGSDRAPAATPAAARAMAELPALAAVRRPGAGGQTAALSPWEISIARFSLLLGALDIDPSLLPALLDWLDADSETRFPGGAEDDYYLDLDAPYRAANRRFAHVSELRLVRGVDAATYDKLAPFVTVLPVRTDINVNLAPIEVLMALGPGIDRPTAEVLDEARRAQPFQTPDGFAAFPLLVGRPLATDGLTTQSSWFALDMQASAGDSALSARALLGRAAPDRVDVIARARGFFHD